MRYARDAATGKMIIELSDMEASQLQDNIFTEVAYTLSQQIIEQIGEELVKETLKNRAAIIARLLPELVKKSMDELEKRINKV
jgi:hypothetical protein